MTAPGTPRLKLLPLKDYRGISGAHDPARFYFWPILGRLYRHRVEMCLAECPGGDKVLEVGCGGGLTFLNLHDIYREISGLDLTADVDVVASVFERQGIKVHLKKGNIVDMPYGDATFDTVLLISILEHLKPSELERATREIFRVLKPDGHLVYGVPVERPLMVLMFRLLGYDIHKEHFSTERQIADAVREIFGVGEIKEMFPILRLLGPVYEVGHFIKRQA